mgnify:CR=1 FL=1
MTCPLVRLFCALVDAGHGQHAQRLARGGRLDGLRPGVVQQKRQRHLFGLLACFVSRQRGAVDLLQARRQQFVRTQAACGFCSSVNVSALPSSTMSPTRNSATLSTFSFFLRIMRTCAGTGS